MRGIPSLVSELDTKAKTSEVILRRSLSIAQLASFRLFRAE